MSGKEIKKNFPEFRLRQYISTIFGKRLKKIGCSKNYSSLKAIHEDLNYTIDDLKIHLESQFEPWMNWQNWGIYNFNTWDDKDQSTWKWNIDHIIPQSKLLFDSFKHPNFKKCWALENLRPYSAKQNIIDGAK